MPIQREFTGKPGQGAAKDHKPGIQSVRFRLLLRRPTSAAHPATAVSHDLWPIDADSRKSAWRTTFKWETSRMKDVQLVRIEDTH